ncbi:hypothetical protein [Epibacterium sp. Ofav1-8]|uniref:hypothetical protein n=1 Tax=Epibacterium sp. Ofav1-8 TaxID=2917735 RepID=UPI001EF3DFD3|nr:hypothetical protein [Epibacterium sp. Ofav1-8]MCG7625390.1 hypothetical protein [Epibacterium sp. Ofav1-8]
MLDASEELGGALAGNCAPCGVGVATEGASISTASARRLGSGPAPTGLELCSAGSRGAPLASEGEALLRGTLCAVT